MDAPPPVFPFGFPLRENCNPDDPYQAFLWMLVALPNMRGGQLVMPVEYLQLISKRLWDLGARPAAPPMLKYRKPATLDAHWMGAPGSWVDVNAPDMDPRTPARQAVDALLPVQKAEQLRELAKDLTPKQLAEEYRRALLEHHTEIQTEQDNASS
jgi:hypothetical protein